ncbi:hypothetical protein [Polyangium sp. 15x6]|uniref:hypothetical protein n=1 Tax=Polyangium sp. 15x6 TaxID=3042687 RepID=UPI00249A4F1C|nr:hypothetical protein [Polyangium sp. 15x6]MDI3290593.1 hypothetical protein [Polyangium sp. 15x6]
MTDKKTWSLTDPPGEPQARGDATPLLVPRPVDPVGGGGEATSAATSDDRSRGPELANRQPIIMGNPKGSRYTTGPSRFEQAEDVLERRRRRTIVALVVMGLVLVALVVFLAFVILRRG